MHAAHRRYVETHTLNPATHTAPAEQHPALPRNISLPPRELEFICCLPGPRKIDAGDVLHLKPMRRQGDCTCCSDVQGLLTHRQPRESNSNGLRVKNSLPKAELPHLGKEKKPTCLRLEKAGIQFPCLKSCSCIPPDCWLLTPFAFEQA